jgi:large subunit ribosomal protein L23
MAIFGLKKRKDEKIEQSAQAAKAVARKAPVAKNAKSAATLRVVAVKDSAAVSVPALKSELATSAASIIIRPRITEKSGILSQGGVYTFEVAKNANKYMVSKAIMTLYKVTPVKVAMVNTPMRRVFVKGRRGQVSGIRKAIVTVKKGEKIDFV